MALAAGDQLGPYEIVAPLGAGGMGEVYKAKDTRLGRDAAIKILPDAFAGEPERLARFEREAKLLASLSHPNIAAVFGLHDVNGVRFLAMELVKGEDLQARVARGPIPVDEALSLARQIAEALEAAHENGVIHRDLKPANIRVTPDGVVKVLDFGLAKAFDTEPASGSDPAGLSPTVTSLGSVVGVILGTAAYMSPEQARGKQVDRRTDIWAFGCVLYEMLTGKRPFDGETVSDSIGKILQTEADLTALPARTPRAARELIVRCLVKDPKKRLRDIGDARLAIDEAMAATPEAAASTSRLPWAIAAVAILAAVVVLALLKRAPTMPADSGGAKFLALNAPEELRLAAHPAMRELAPDGRSIVTVATSKTGDTGLYQRRFDDPEWRLLPGTEGAYFPFWSPDGRFVGFFAGDKLKKVTIGGGTAEVVCDAAAGRGGTWSRDGVIVFAPGSSGPLMQVKAEGGRVTPATELDASRGEVGHRFPRFLPDGRHFLYATIPGKAGSWESFFATLGSKERTLVVSSDGVPTFAPPNHLVFRRNKMLYEQSFDPASGRVSGEARAIVAAGVPSGFFACPSSTAAGTGLLAFSPLVDVGTELTWFTLEGVQGETLPLPKGQYSEARISPDGARVATARFQEDNPVTAGADIYLVDLARGGSSRVTFDPQIEYSAVWSPDGTWIYFTGNKTGSYLIYRLSSEGAGEAVAVSKPHGLSQQPDTITPDGRTLVFGTQEATTGYDLLTLDTSGTSAPVPYLNSTYNETDARIFPDGRWISYISDETGREEVYVQSFPTPGSKIQVSNAGGTAPAWARDGKRLFYVTPDDSLMACDVTPGPSIRVGLPTRLFRFPRPVASIDIAQDGKRVLAIIANNDVSGRTIGVILDWVAAAK